MANFQILAFFFFFKLNLKQLYLFPLVLSFFFYTHIKTQVNRNFSTSTFLLFWYLDEP